MSHKTEGLYRELDNLDALCTKLKDYSEEKNDRVVDDIQFEMFHSLGLLRMWVDSLYRFNGKSRSSAKQTASRTNGKKGGRPPKEIAAAKSRIFQIEQQLEDLGELNPGPESRGLLEERDALLQKIKAWQESKALS